MEFSDRSVIVTGGTGTLGSAVVSDLLAQGARCHVPYVIAAEAERFPHRGHERLRLLPVSDLAEEAAVAALYGGIGPLWASIHIAGGFAMSGIAETGRDALMAQLEMNLVTAYLCCAAAVRAMRGSGGRIVNVASRPALEPRQGAGMIAYTVSKAGVAALTAALAQEVAGDGILVNAVAPSIIDTPANRQAMAKADFALWPKPEEIAATIVFLASPGNQVTRGAIVPVYGRS